jgi:hypothetical protein
MHASPKKGKAMACRIAISFAAVAMSISCIATDASATCKFNAKKDIWPAPGSEDTELGVLMELEVGHGETEVYARVQA